MSEQIKVKVGEVVNGRGLPIVITNQDFLPSRGEVESAKNLPALNYKQDLFCQLFCSPRFFFDLRAAYKEAFGCSQNTANSNVYKLMNDARVLLRIEEYLAIGGFNQQTIDLALLDNIKQNEERSVKQRAIEHFNSLRGRIVAKTENTNLNVNLSLSSLLKKAKEAKRSEKVIDAEVEIEESTDSKERED